MWDVALRQMEFVPSPIREVRCSALDADKAYSALKTVLDGPVSGITPGFNTGACSSQRGVAA